jgi:cytochrome c553
MSRFTTTLITAVAAAIAAVAVVALPAIGGAGTKGTEKNNPDVSALAACLATHGLKGAPTTGRELKAWLASKEAADPRGVKTAIAACKGSVPDSGAPAGPDAQALITCLRSHGVDAPTAPDEFKPWLAEQQRGGGSKALDDALTACNMPLTPDAKAPAPSKPDCGAPAGKTGPPVEKPKQPASPSDTNGT